MSRTRCDDPAAIFLDSTDATSCPWLSISSARSIRIRMPSGGLAVYIGLVPAEIVRGHPADYPERTMHGGPRPHGGEHEYHLVAAVFDAATADRVSDARVSARIAGLGLGKSIHRAAKSIIR